MADADTLPPTFLDRFERLLDGGWRVVLPKDWRSLKVTEFIVIENSAGSAIHVLTRADFEKRIARVETDHQDNVEKLNEELGKIGPAAKRVVLDKEGRLTLPQSLCAKIGISPENPGLVLMGAVRSFTIWNAEKLERIESLRAALAAEGHGQSTPQKTLGL
jgi:DNA-binding transcriptional regulator/RsmH inhibitor MraZ